MILLITPSAHRARAITKYTMTGGGHFPPFRFAVLPVASTLDSVLGRVPPARRNIHQRHTGQTKIIFS